MATTREIGREQHEAARRRRGDRRPRRGRGRRPAAAALEAVEQRAPRPLRCPRPRRSSTTCAAAARRRSRSCAASTRCGACLRVVTLIALDALGVYAALLLALAAKAAVQGDWNLDVSADQAYDYWTFAFLITALLFARSGLYSNRSSRPGPARRRLVAVLGDGRDARLRRGGRPGVLELLHLLGLAAVRDRDRQRAALGLRRAQRRDPARRGLPPPRGARRHERPPRRTSATRCARRRRSRSSASSR